MNILILSRGIPSVRDAQFGGFEFDQAKALARMGHRVIMASLDTRFRLFWRKPGVTIREQNGVTTYYMFYCPAVILRLLGKRLSERIICWQWKKLATIIQHDIPHIDIVYAHYLFIAYYAVQCFDNIKAPILAMEHWSALNQEPIRPEIARMAQFTYPKLSQILAVSEPLKLRIQQKFNVSPIVVHNMVGNEFSYTSSLLNKPFTFICVGSLLPIKNHTLLVSALAQSSIPKDQWQLIIIGEGKERNPLQNQINNTGLSENIHLVGLKDKQTIAQMLNASHVFVLPSLSENFSVAVLEALACGLPVIASICGGIRECINEKNGILFEVNDRNGLTKALEHMFYHYSEYNRQEIANDCKAHFSSEVIAKLLTDIFNDIKK